jgi:predicted Rossmann fold flavoprotein
MEKYQVIVIGGGAAGLMAAITAARHKETVLIIEKNIVLGRKILVTGNGRCNLTNLNITLDKYHGTNIHGLHNIFARFSVKETMSFFEELGVRLKTEERGRVFPVTNQASTVVDLLTEEINQLGIKNQLAECVTSLNSKSDGWQVTTQKASYLSPRVILSTGGKSYPQLGSTGEGFDLVRKLGHKIIEPKPALVPLELNGNWFHKLQGVKSDVELIVALPKKTIACETGELLFTHYGVSGPMVLDMSRLIMDYYAKLETQVTINFFPGQSAESLSQLLVERWQSQPKKTLANSLLGLLPKKLGQVLTAELKTDDKIPVNQINKKELIRISTQLTCWPLSIKRTRSFEESMVTAGGIPLDEVNTRTMESLKCKGLYLAGEVLDIDGVSGGYNLQFAWSTGYLAGLH